MPQELVTPVGRIVWGNPGKSQKKTDAQTKQPILRDGQQVEQWAFGLAIPKADFERNLWPVLYAEAAAAFPQGIPQSFAYKVKDGDGVDGNGKPFSDREGYAGHYVLTVSTEAFAPPIYKNEGGRYRQMDPSEVKCGDYVAVAINVKYNDQRAPKTPGLYINPTMIDFVGYGSEIITTGGDPTETFGGRTYQLPPGASAIPIASSSNVAPPTGAPQPGNGYAAPAAPSAQAYPPPAHDFVQNAGQPPAPPAAQPYGAPGMSAHPQQPQPPAAPGGYAPQPPAPGVPQAPAAGGMPPGIPQGR